MGIAHRGASAYAPENTVAAFDEAIRLGAAAVEFDVRLTADGIPVVLHDATLDRTTNGHGAVARRTWVELLRLDAGSWKHPRFAGTRIPTVEEALRAMDRRAIPVLELKTPLDPQRLQRLLADHAVLDHAVVLSFQAPLLAKLHRCMRRLTLGLLANRWRPGLPRLCQQVDAQILALSYSALTRQRAQRVAGEKRRLWCYTVNDVAAIAACTAVGVEGVITDYPDRIGARPKT